MDVSAIVSTSAYANSVAEAFGVSALDQVVVATALPASAERLAFLARLDQVGSAAARSVDAPAVQIAPSVVGARPADVPVLPIPVAVSVSVSGGESAVAPVTAAVSVSVGAVATGDDPPAASVGGTGTGTGYGTVSAATSSTVTSSTSSASSSTADVVAASRAVRVPALLSTLSALTRAGVRDYLAQHPDAVADLLAAPPAASTVAQWWSNQSLRSQADLTAGAPELIGNLEGLPYAVRAATNERYLASAIDALTEQRSTAGRAAAADITARLHMLEQVSDAIGSSTAGQARSLISLDVTGAGRAVIVIGDLATADYVTYMVPGMFYSVDTELVGWTAAAAQLATDQQQWLERLAPNQSASVATVAWIGYQTPSLVDVTSLDLARVGSVALADSLQGLTTLRGADLPYLSILTHSYGSTVALLALDRAAHGPAGVTVDSLAMVGSPGSDAKTVADLNVRGGNVWVADAVLDPVSHAGVFGSQPLSPEYGARPFGVTGATDPLSGVELAGSVGHVDYFTAGSESFRNMALISIGRGGYALDPDGRTGAQARALAR